MNIPARSVMPGLATVRLSGTSPALKKEGDAAALFVQWVDDDSRF